MINSNIRTKIRNSRHSFLQETSIQKETMAESKRPFYYICKLKTTKQLTKMKNILLPAVFATALFISCQNSSGDKTKTSTEQEVSEQTGTVYEVDTTSSAVKWTGYHKGGFDPRVGTIQAKGTISVENGTVSGATIIIDINSILTDESSVDVNKTGGKTAADLDSHLKNEDFFEVETYPTAKFEITSVVPFDIEKDKSVIEGATDVISGNLTIKDKTLNVTFPAKVSIEGNTIAVESKFTINRQDWGLTYGTEGDPLDWMISPDIDLELNIKGQK